jgi:hypothetical protein
VSSLDQRRLDAFRRFTATGCAEALAELDRLAAREGARATITQADLEDLATKAYILIPCTHQAIADARSDSDDPYSGRFQVDVVIRSIASAMARDTGVWPVSGLMGVPDIGGTYSESTVRKALSYMVKDPKDSRGLPLEKHGSRPALYGLRAPKLKESALLKAAGQLKDPRCKRFRVRTSRLRDHKISRSWGGPRGRRLFRAMDRLKALRAEQAEAARLEVEDDVFFCAVC